MLKRFLTRATDRIYEMPVLVLMPHSRCNCRCVMCDIWKANHHKQELTVETLQKHVEAFRKLNVKHVALSGGEALMHANLWKFCEVLKSIGINVALLSTGIALKAHAVDVVKWCDEVIVSLDGPPEKHNEIRNIPQAYEKLAEGVLALKALKKNFRVTGRTVLQKLNFKDYPEILQSAQSLGLDQISFLSADVSSSAFNRAESWTEEKIVQIELSPEEADEFEYILKQSFAQHPHLYEKKYVAESPAKLLSLVQYYRAIHGVGTFPSRTCNAPWVSAVIEADGEVRPCFFHASYGNIYQDDFDIIINSPKAISFRKNLNMASDKTCQRCVCSLHIGLRQTV
jgi:Fe-coproporphyrin III synthase